MSNSPVVESVREALTAVGITELNTMQKEVCRAAATTDNDLLLVSSVGSGKTLAYLLPLLGSLDASADTVQAVVIAPSRELAMQIQRVFASLKSECRSLCCYGGHDINSELRSLLTPPQLVIATPGRLTDHLKRRLDLSGVRMAVVDEYDKSLEMGFEPQMREIFASLSSDCRRILTSATEAVPVPDYIDRGRFAIMRFGRDSQRGTVKRLLLECDDRKDALLRVVCSLSGASAIVFCNYRQSAEQVARFLENKGVDAVLFHGAMEQPSRERSLVKFRGGSANVLVSTDLAARGIDVESLGCVIHFELPTTEEQFIHRNGRTARMSADGCVVVLTTKGERTEYALDGYETMTMPRTTTPAKASFVTVYIGRGRKEKISKGDIVGFFCVKGGLTKEQIGYIEIKDHYAYVSIPAEKSGIISSLCEEKLKGRKTKLALSY